MGSLSPHPSPPPPSSSSSQSHPNHGIYLSFCSKYPSTNANISNWIECYDPSSNGWHRVTTIPGLMENQVLKGFSMVSIGHFFYLIGGRLCDKLPGHVQDEAVEVNTEVLPWVLRYDVRSDSWSKCAPLRTPRFDFACTVSDGKIYVAGGKSTLACPRGISSAEVYDPAIDEWKALPNMSTLRYKCVGVTWQGKIHVVGGFAVNAGSGDPSAEGWNTRERSSAEVYDSERDKWDLVVGMWQLDVPPNQIVAADGNLFSCGDCLNAWKGHVEAYDQKLNMWNPVDGSSMPSPISTLDATPSRWPPIERTYLTMAPVGARLYLLAGYKMSGEISRSVSIVHVFNTSTNEYDEYGWIRIEPTEEEGEKELCGHCCVVRQPF